MLKERNLCGSSRLGINTDSLELIGVSPLYSSAAFNLSLGLKQFELTNHLGNVLAVVSDRKLAHPNGGFSLSEMKTEFEYHTQTLHSN